MKKIVLLKLVPLLMMALALPPVARAESITHTATYNYSKLTIGTDTLGGVAYTTVSYDGLNNGGVPGAPSLPVDYIRFSVPYNATDFTVSATTRFEMMSNIGNLVYPCQTPRLTNDTTGQQITLPDSAYYFSGGLYPSQRAVVVDEGYLAGENHIVTVAVMPIAFRHQFNGISWSNQLAKPLFVNLTLNYWLADTPTTSVLVRKDTVLRNEGFTLTRSMVVNPDLVRVNAVPDTSVYMHYSGNGFVQPEPSYSVDTTATYLIVTTQELKHSLRRLAALKRQKGYSVKVVTMDEVLASPYSGDGDMVLDEHGNYQVAYGDDAGKLREYLRYCFHNLGTEYVLLAGTDVPYRIIYLTDTYKDSIYYAPTDMYYNCLTGDWSDGVIDYSHELHVGRILSTSWTQIDNYTDKLLRYELNPGQGDYSYLKRAFFLKGREFDSMLDRPMMHLTAYYPNQISITDTFGNNSGHPNGVDIIDSLNNNHVGLLIPFNHGSPNRIKVYGPDSSGRNYYTYSSDDMNEVNGDGIDCLNNKDYPMILYAPSCRTIPYDYTSGMNFGESFTTGKDYGGPVYIGYTRHVHSTQISEILNMFTLILPRFNYKLGNTDSYSKEFYCNITDYQNDIIVHSYLGDPTIELWTDIPQEYANISINRTENSITVSGLDNDSTIIAYCDKDNNSGYQLSQSANVTLNSVSPNSTIMLYKHNHLPYIAPLALQNINIKNSQYVIASDVTAGFIVDKSRLAGNVVVKSGTEYEIEATGTVTLDGGFKVEEGATFAVYPACF